MYQADVTKNNEMYTDGMLCALFFFHAYPTVHDKIRSMTKIVGVAHGDNDRCCRASGLIFNAFDLAFDSLAS